MRTAGLEQVIAPLMISEQLGARLGGDGAALIGNIVGQFLGGRRKEPAPGQGAGDRPGEPPLKVLPTVRLAGGGGGRAVRGAERPAAAAVLSPPN